MACEKVGQRFSSETRRAEGRRFIEFSRRYCTAQDQVSGLEEMLVEPASSGEPRGPRLFVEDIDEFSKVKEILAADVSSHLNECGFLDISEDRVQEAIEEILSVPYHKKDWGGEINDLYSANVHVAGHRTTAAFLLKGNGLRKTQLQIKDCGKNGDQIVRLFDSPADLFVVQFVGNIAENVIRDVESKTELRNREGKTARYVIIDGQDTARLLAAYGKF